MNVRDEIEYHPHGMSELNYRGIIIWMDEEDMGISIIAPPEVRGSYETISIKKAEPTLVSKYNPTSFKTDLAKLTPAELKVEIEALRGRRLKASISGRPVKVDSKEGILLGKLAHLPESVIDELLKKASEEK